MDDTEGAAIKTHFITISNNPQKGEQLIRTCNHFGITVTHIKPNDWQGNLQKIFEMQNFIRDKNDSDILIFADAYDCLALGDINEAVNKFTSMNCDLLCSAELNCHPFKQFASRFENIPRSSKSRHIYPNTGLYMGRVSAIRHYCNSITRQQLIKDYTFNNGRYSTDQGRFHVYYLARYGAKAPEGAEGEVGSTKASEMEEKVGRWAERLLKKEEEDEGLNIKLDHDCEIFQNMHKAHWKDFSFESGKLRNNVLNSTPSFIHFSGGSDRIHNGEDGVLTDLADRIIFFNQNIDERVPLTLNKAFHKEGEINQKK